MIQVELVVSTGKHAGRAIPVSRRKFFIGRASDCKLRPSGDAISRHHCAIVIEDDFVAVRDFGSRTGTFVNDHQVPREQELTSGDRLRLGEWEFEVRMTAEPGAPCEPKAESPPEPKVEHPPQPKPEPAAEKEPIDPDDMDLSDWFSEAEDEPAEMVDLLEGLKGPAAARRAEDNLDAESDEPEEPFVRDKSEAEKDRRRREAEIVGVSKAVQARRTADTTREGAADALRKLLTGGASK